MKNKEKKKSGLGLRALITAMSVCTVFLFGVLGYALFGSVRFEMGSGHGIGIVDAFNNMGVTKKNQELAAKQDINEPDNQSMTAKDQILHDDENAEVLTEESSQEETKHEELKQEEIESNIEATKEEVYKKINQATMLNPLSGVVDIMEFDDITANQIKGWIEEYSYGNWLYLDGTEATNAEIAQILERRNIEAIQDPVQLRYAIMMQNTAVRAFPSWRKASKDVSDNSFDYFQESMLMLGETVLVLHQTADEIWSFVQASNYRGWIETSHIAMCTQDEAIKWEEAKNAIVIDVQINVSEKKLRMGTELVVKQTGEKSVTVKLPVVGEDGMFATKDVEIENSGISLGYLNLSQKNVVEQAQKLIGVNYGWGDSNGDMDCSSTMNAIYRCFGLVLPRNTSQLKETGVKVVSFENMTQTEKLDQIHQMQPGTLILMKGHVVMYMGEDMILHNFTTCLAPDGIGTENVYQCRITPLNLVTASKVQYLDAYTHAVCILDNDTGM